MGLIGGWDGPVKAMFLLMALDLITGLLCAFLGKSNSSESGLFSSREMYMGLSRKLMMTVMVIAASTLDNMLNLNDISRSAVIGFYCVNETLSIVENAAVLGVPFPKAIKAALERKKEDNGNMTDTNTNPKN
ncbi:MAG: phage holin family protein [Eubacteriales bacterium]|nr:phage holin family protein [Eubacteriales bacterium]